MSAFRAGSGEKTVVTGHGTYFCTGGQAHPAAALENASQSAPGASASVQITSNNHLLRASLRSVQSADSSPGDDVDAPPFQPQAIREYFDPQFQPAPCREAVRLWPFPMAAHQEAETGAWQEWVPRFNASDIQCVELMQQPADAVSWDPPLVTLLEQIPSPVLDALEEVPTRLWFDCLRCTHAVPAIVDLFTTDRTLALLLANNYRRGSPEMRWPELRRVLGSKRRELLPLLSLPADESILRILRRVDPLVLDAVGAQEIRGALLVDDQRLRRAIRHVPVLTGDTILMLADPHTRGMVTPALLLEEDHTGLYGDLRWVGVNRDMGILPQRPRRFASTEQVRALREARNQPDPGDAPYDPTAYPRDWQVPSGDCVLVDAMPYISLTPVRDAFELRDHGLGMETCLATLGKYPAMASDGRAALYEANFDEGEPEFWEPRSSFRASVWLRRGEYGWTVTEAGLPRNKGEPPVAVMERIEGWAWSLPADPRRPDPTSEMVAAVEQHTTWRATEVHPFTVLFESPRRRRAIVRIWWGEMLHFGALDRMIRTYRRHEGEPVQVVVLVCPKGVMFTAHGAAAARTRPAVLLGIPNGADTAIAAESRRVQDQDRLLTMAAARAIAIE